MTRYTAAPLDSVAGWLTNGFWVIAVALLAGGAAQLVRGGDGGGGVGLLVAGVVLVAFRIYYRRQQPLAYEIGSAGVTVFTRAGTPRRFSGPTAVVAGARLAFRTFGSGGLYGYLGSFRLGGDASGPVKAFVSDRSRIVVIQAVDTRVAISPDNPHALLAETASWG